MATIPRPYGVGLYGVDRYGVYTGAIVVVGGASSIRFTTQAVANRAVSIGGVVRIEFSLQGVLVRSWEALAPCESGTWQQEFPPWTERMAA